MIIKSVDQIKTNLKISKHKNSIIDRSLNASQNTERLRTSHRVANSQQNSPRFSHSQHVGKELRQSMHAANSYLDIPYESLGE